MTHMKEGPGEYQVCDRVVKRGSQPFGYKTCKKGKKDRKWTIDLLMVATMASMNREG